MRMLQLLPFFLLGFQPVLSENGEAFIQIFDFIDQNKTSSNDPALVLTEEMSSTDLFKVQETITFDLYELGYMDSSKKFTVNASTYQLSLQRINSGQVIYQHPFETPLSLEEGENAAVFVDEDSDDVLIGSVCHTGRSPAPGLDEAVVILCPTDPQRFDDLTQFSVTGSNTGCKGCKSGNEIPVDVVHDSIHFTVDDTNFEWSFTVLYKGIEVCSNKWIFGDGAVYTMHLKETEDKSKPTPGRISYNCYLSVTNAPSDYWLPIWLPIVLFFVIVLIIALLVLLDRAFPRIREEALKRVGLWTAPSDEKPMQPKNPRLNSLDTFRGLAVVLMIFVNFGAGRYFFLEHAAWNGLTLADFVFPWFLFMVGVSIVLSVQTQLKSNVSKLEILKKVGIRFLKLFLIGIFLNTGIPGGAELGEWRIPGVLQRVAFAYLVCAVVEILFIPRLTDTNSYGGGETITVPVEGNEYNECGKFLSEEQPDIPAKKGGWGRFGQSSSAGEQPCSGRTLLYHTWPQWVIMVLLTGIWAAVTYAMPIPGCPTGYMGAGGIADGGKYSNCTGGAAGYIDRLIFGNNMYQQPTCKALYQTTLYHDPEGILGSLTSVLSVYLGVLAGHVIVTNKSSRGGVLLRLLILALISIVGGIVLSKASLGSDAWVPINKNLWTPSFVLLTSGTAYALLALFFLLIDCKQCCCGFPLRSAGKNPLFLYIGSVVLFNYFPFNWATSLTHGSLMAQSIIGTLCWLGVGLWLDAKEIYYKI